MSSEPPTATSSPKTRQNGNPDCCPSCGQAFDAGKKRRLVDACGHERCYACMFRRQECPICLQGNFNKEGQDTFPFENTCLVFCNDIYLLKFRAILHIFALLGNSNYPVKRYHASLPASSFYFPRQISRTSHVFMPFN